MLSQEPYIIMLEIIILNQPQKKLQHYEFLTDARLRNQEKPFQNRSADWAEKALNHRPIMLLIFNSLKKLLTTMHKMNTSKRFNHQPHWFRFCINQGKNFQLHH